MAKNKTKPGRSQGREKWVPIPFTRPHSERVKETKKTSRRNARKEAREYYF